MKSDAPHHDLNTLLALAEGRLGAAERAALVASVLQYPERAAELKLALRLAGPAQMLASSWVAQAEQVQSERLSWWTGLLRPALGLGVAAALVLAIGTLNAPGTGHYPQQVNILAQNDHFNSVSFEGGEDSFMTGGFEPAHAADSR